MFIICSETGVRVWRDSFSWEERLWILDVDDDDDDDDDDDELFLWYGWPTKGV